MSNQSPLKADDWLITDRPSGWFLQYRLPPTLLHYAGRALAFFLISAAMFDLFGLFSRLTQADYCFSIFDFWFLLRVPSGPEPPVRFGKGWQRHHPRGNFS